MTGIQPLILETKARGRKVEQTRLMPDGKMQKRSTEQLRQVTVRCGDAVCEFARCEVQTVENLDAAPNVLPPLLGIPGTRITIADVDGQPAEIIIGE